MRVGNRKVIYSQTFLVPNGEAVSDVFQYGDKSFQFDLTIEENPKPEYRRKISWEFYETGRLKMIVGGPHDPFGTVMVSRGFLKIAELNGHAFGVVASYTHQRGLSTLHLQFQLEAGE